ncbi:MAG TPA: dihydroorotate dehydrogenase 2 [Chloroflexota bacterium]|jgi:dihydroorotate dehydrogenase (fumarate)/dihydroorotate dehydrogenase
MSLYSSILRPWLFRLPADQAHDLARAALAWPAPWRLVARGLPSPDPRLATDFCGLRLRSPIGLAAGFDKDADCVRGLGALGFAYLTLGSIMSEPRPGNPRPRLGRVVRQEGITNALGLPSKGRSYAEARLRRLGARPVPLIANVCGFSPEELAAATRDLQPYVDAVEIGLICPQTGDQGGLGTLATFERLVAALAAVRRVPVLVKLPPHRNPADADLVRAMVRLCLDGGLDGLTVGGGRPVQDRRLAVGRGSLSGRPIRADILRITRDVAAWSEGRLPIKAGGGALRGDDVLALLQAGATAVEVYAAFVYRGPWVAVALERELGTALGRAVLASVRELRPADRTDEPVSVGTRAQPPPA